MKDIWAGQSPLTSGQQKNPKKFIQQKQQLQGRYNIGRRQ